MYDDVASSESNPRPGQLFNRPHGPDVYAGLQIVRSSCLGKGAAAGHRGKQHALCATAASGPWHWHWHALPTLPFRRLAPTGLLPHRCHRRNIPGGAGGQHERRAAAVAPLLGPRAGRWAGGQGEGWVGGLGWVLGAEA